MAMQAKAWMTQFLFLSWIAHFVKALESSGGISPINRHLLILDKHNSHVTLDVVYKAKQNGLDFLTLPSHTSHRLQPVDCSIFRSFKCAFRGYRDAWTLENWGRVAQKEDLAEWVSLALKKALTPQNIKEGFKATGIWLLNAQAVADKISPSQQFCEVTILGLADAATNEHNPQVFVNTVDSDVDSSDNKIDDDGQVLDSSHAAEGDIGNPACVTTIQSVGPTQPLESSSAQYYVHGPAEADSVSMEGTMEAKVGAFNEDRANSQGLLSCFLQLPELPLVPMRRMAAKPIMDYTKSIIITSDDYIKAMEAVRKQQRKTKT